MNLLNKIFGIKPANVHSPPPGEVSATPALRAAVANHLTMGESPIVVVSGASEEEVAYLFFAKRKVCVFRTEGMRQIVFNPGNKLPGFGGEYFLGSIRGVDIEEVRLNLNLYFESASGHTLECRLLEKEELVGLF